MQGLNCLHVPPGLVYVLSQTCRFPHKNWKRFSNRNRNRIYTVPTSSFGHNQHFTGEILIIRTLNRSSCHQRLLKFMSFTSFAKKAFLKSLQLRRMMWKEVRYRVKNLFYLDNKYEDIILLFYFAAARCCPLQQYSLLCWGW